MLCSRHVVLDALPLSRLSSPVKTYGGTLRRPSTSISWVFVEHILHIPVNKVEIQKPSFRIESILFYGMHKKEPIP